MSPSNHGFMVYLKQAWLVILLALVYGAGLAGVQVGLSPRIEQNKKDETYRVIPDLVPGADARWIEETRVPVEGKEILVYRANSQAGDPLGWVVPASGQGFADKIEILIGLDPEVQTITGVYVLNQKETPGLGDYITGIDFTSRFAGKSTGERLEAVRGGAVKDNQIDAITGATISSNAVTSIVNTAVETLGGALRERASGKEKSG